MRVSDVKAAASHGIPEEGAAGHGQMFAQALSTHAHGERAEGAHHHHPAGGAGQQKAAQTQSEQPTAAGSPGTGGAHACAGHAASGGAATQSAGKKMAPEFFDHTAAAMQAGGPHMHPEFTAAERGFHLPEDGPGAGPNPTSGMPSAMIEVKLTP